LAEQVSGNRVTIEQVRKPPLRDLNRVLSMVLAYAGKMAG